MAVDTSRDINKHNVNFAFPMGEETKKLISEYFGVEKIEEQLMADMRGAKDDLQRLESLEIEIMLTEEAEPQSKKRTGEIKALREKAIGLEGKTQACRVKKAELKAAILESSRKDKVDWIENKLSQELKEVVDESKRAYWEFLSAMALAAVRQIMHGSRSLGMARSSGPEFCGFLTGAEYAFYNQELDRYLNEMGIKTEFGGISHVFNRDSLPSVERKRKLQEIQSAAVDLRHVDPDIEQILNRAREETAAADADAEKIIEQS